MKREIEAIRLKTKMSEAFAATRLPYPKQAAIAKMQLNALQESYKQLTGEYAKEFVIQENSDSGVYGNNVKYTTKNDQKYLNAKDIAELILGPDAWDYDMFKQWIVEITNAGS